jgi:hypothetical protein
MKYEANELAINKKIAIDFVVNLLKNIKNAIK